MPQVILNGETLDVQTLTTAQIIETYNTLAQAMGETTTVNRFSNRSRAESRFISICERWADYQEPAPVSRPVEEDIFAAKQEEELLERLAPETVTLSPEDQQQVTAEAQGRPAAPVSTSTRWAKPKREEPARVAYRARSGSLQQVMYLLLTREGGVTMSEFCEAMRATGTKDKTLYTPSSVWSALRYLFCALRGYGLSFDGTHLRLLVPADERESLPSKKKEA